MNSLKRYYTNQLDKEDIHIWHIPLIAQVDQYVTYRSLLDEVELAQADRFKYDRHRRRFTIGRAVKRIILAHYAKCEPDQLLLGTLEKGKPYLKNSRIQFNLTNSADEAILAIGLDHIIGVDMEAVRHDVSFLELANRFFSDEESKALMTADKDDLASNFFRIWTRKEAFIKATGDGLSFPLKNFRVNFAANEPAALLETKWDQSERQYWTLKNLQAKEGFISALAVRSTIKKLDHYYWKHS